MTPTKEECKMKKVWQKPRLVVLMRCRPEETVLGYCKKTDTWGPGGGECGGYLIGDPPVGVACKAPMDS